jgi:hypothetical protein
MVATHIGRRLMTIAIALVAMAATQTPPAAVGSPVAPTRERVIVDTLGVDPSTTFSVFGSGGQAVFTDQVIGPRFTLERRTRLTEIGAYLNNCEQIAQPERCRDTGPFTVQIRPEKNGVPDPDVVLATLVLSHDNDPFVVRYESVRPHIRPLRAGTYFALFAPQRTEDVGELLGTANSGAYTAGLVDLGYITPAGAFDAGVIPAAVRILGVPLGKHH